VYSWDGTGLVLLPVCSQEYQESLSHTSLIKQKVSSKELKEGSVYITKEHKKLLYMGRHIWFDKPDKYGTIDVKGKKSYVFVDLSDDFHRENYSWENAYEFRRREFVLMSGLDRIAEEISSDHPEYADYYQKMMDLGVISACKGLYGIPIKGIWSVGYRHEVCAKIGDRFYIGTIIDKYSCPIYSGSNRMVAEGVFRYKKEAVIENGEFKIKNLKEEKTIEYPYSQKFQENFSELWVDFEGERKPIMVIR